MKYEKISILLHMCVMVLVIGIGWVTGEISVSSIYPLSVDWLLLCLLQGVIVADLVSLILIGARNYKWASTITAVAGLLTLPAGVWLLGSSITLRNRGHSGIGMSTRTFIILTVCAFTSMSVFIAIDNLASH